MMTLGALKLYAPAALLAGLAAPLSAAAPGPAGGADAASKPLPLPEGNGEVAGHTRMVELPFLLDTGSPDRETRAPVRQERAGPHPFRESALQKASLAAVPAGVAEPRDPRLSRYPEFG
jgi:hypothetical protein